jgi:hypothetical protein
MTAMASMSFATIAVAGLSITNGVPEQDGAAAVAINDVREVRAAVAACWNALGNAAPPLAQVTVRLSFDRNGKVVGQPLIAYANPAPSEEGRVALREAVAQALARCVPLPLADRFRDVIAVHPISVRLGNGWK